MIRQDFADFPSRKRNLALYKVHFTSTQLTNTLDQYFFHLNGFLEDNPNELEGWQELALVYHETGNIQKAAYCYEELMMLNPRNDHYFVRLGELLYSLAGAQNLRNAKDYFCYVVARDDKNYRALWCLNRVCRALLTEHETSDKLKSLFDVAVRFYTGFHH